MKFGNLLRDSAEGLPEVQALFASYKVLKKRLKRLPERSQPQDAQQASEDNSSGGQPPADAAGDQGEEQFVQTLLQDVANFNDVFIEKEEDAVIVLRTLEEAAEAAVTAEALQHVLKRYVDFHGEMLLLVHWSILAYTGLVKILKKHHKRTGLLVRAPQLQNLLGQPFCSTELMTDFVHKAELKVDELARRLQLDGASLPASSVSAVPPLGQLLHAAHGSTGLTSVEAALAAPDSSSDEESSQQAASASELGRQGGKRKRTPEDNVCRPRGAASALPSHPSHPADSATPAEPAAGPASPPGSTKQACQPVDAAAAGEPAPGPVAGAPSGAASVGGAEAFVHGSKAHQMSLALGLWEQLHETASTPSTVLPPTHRWSAGPASSIGTNQSCT